MLIVGVFGFERMQRGDAVCDAIRQNSAVLRDVVIESYGVEQVEARPPVQLPDDPNVPPAVVDYMERIVNGLRAQPLQTEARERRDEVLARIPTTC